MSLAGLAQVCLAVVCVSGVATLCMLASAIYMHHLLITDVLKRALRVLEKSVAAMGSRQLPDKMLKRLMAEFHLVDGTGEPARADDKNSSSDAPKRAFAPTFAQESDPQYDTLREVEGKMFKSAKAANADK